MKYSLFYCLIALLYFSCQGGTKESDGEVQSADSVLTTSVLDSITLLIRKDPKNSELYYLRAKAYVEEEMFLLAKEDIIRSLKIDSTSSKYHSFKGDIEYFSAKPDLARDSFKKALELDPNNTDAILKLAEIQLLLRNYQECFNMVNSALRINDQLFMGYYIKGYAHLELGDTTLALSSIQTAVELNPQFYNGFMTLGYLHGVMNSNIAIEYYNSALEVKPGDKEAMYNLGKFLQDQGRLEDANLVYDRMIELDPYSVRAWYNKGFILLELKENPTEAIPFFIKTVELSPQYVDAIFNLGLCYEQLDRIEEAREQYRKALEINPQYDFAALGMERLQRLK